MSARDIKSRHQRAGYLYKLPMSKGDGSKWQKRLFVAKDGFLLYYGANTPVSMPHFDTKPKGVIPLGGCHVEAIERGPGKSKFGIKITHPDFVAGRALVLASEKADDQTAWLQALNDCSRVTMENALLGDSMIEKLRAAGTEASKEKEDVLLKLQENAMALANERDEKLKLQAEQETVLNKGSELVKEAEERIKQKEAEMAVALAEVEKRRADLEVQAGEFAKEIDSRSTQLQSANSEYEKVQSMMAAARSKAGIAAVAPASASSLANDDGAPTSPGGFSSSVPSKASHTQATTATAELSSEERTKIAAAAGMNLAQFETVEKRARQLEEEKLRLEREKTALERSMRDMANTQATLQENLDDAVSSRKRMEDQMASLNSEEGDLIQERALRKALERKLAVAEESLRRLDSSLKRSGVKLDVEIFQDVRTLMLYFEERAEESKRDAQRIELMKKALKAKRRYLVASAKAEEGEEGEAVLTEAMEGDDGWGSGNEDDKQEAKPSWFFSGMRAAASATSGIKAAITGGAAKAPAPAPAPSKAAAAAAPAAVAPTPAPAAAADDDDGWNSDGDEDEANSSLGGDGAGDGGVKADTVVVTEDGVTITYKDEKGAMPAGWARQTDTEGDTWYYNNVSGETSWIRPNADGSVPAA